MAYWVGDAFLEEESLPLRNPALAASKEEGQKLEITVLVGDEKTSNIIEASPHQR